LRSTWRLERLFRELQPAIVHTYATKPSVWGRIAARRAQVPVVIGTLPGLGSLYSAAGADSGGLSRKVYEQLQKYAGRCSDMTVFQNEEDLAYFRGSGLVTEAGSMLIAGSGVATDHFEPSRVTEEARNTIRGELRLQPGAIVVTMVSRVMRAKGVMDYVETAAAVRARDPRVRFLLVGPDDHESPDALTEAEWVQLRGSVEWLGMRTDVREILAVSDLFVLPSCYREGIPRALLEAASMGLPLIATRIPVCRDVVEVERNGVLVEMRAPGELQQAVERLVGDRDLRVRWGEASYRLARERFDLVVVAEQSANLYESLLRRANGHGGMVIAGVPSRAPIRPGSSGARRGASSPERH
jgi:glycosyltransferase involved in cell wall biosynthesis